MVSRVEGKSKETSLDVLRVVFGAEDKMSDILGLARIAKRA
jgi:hypothetical protein